MKANTHRPEDIIPPVSRDLLLDELTADKFLRETNNARNQIFIFDAHDSPMLMREVARLRELSFRMAGGGTGLSLDEDDFDSMPSPYKQLIVWDPEEKQIVGGYRYILCPEAPLDETGKPRLATSELFNFSQTFLHQYLPYTIELGRSFVQPDYQPSRDNRKGIFSLDNLWDGLGALVVDHRDMKYFFGKVTMYTHFNVLARDLILHYLYEFFPDHEKLVTPLQPLVLKTPQEELMASFEPEKGAEHNFRILQQLVRNQGENIPPLVSSYANLSPSMRTFGTAINEHFGGVEETAILVTIEDIYPAKKERHVNTYDPGQIGLNLK